MLIENELSLCFLHQGLKDFQGGHTSHLGLFDALEDLEFFAYRIASFWECTKHRWHLDSGGNRMKLLVEVP